MVAAAAAAVSLVRFFPAGCLDSISADGDRFIFPGVTFQNNSCKLFKKNMKTQRNGTKGSLQKIVFVLINQKQATVDYIFDVLRVTMPSSLMAILTFLVLEFCCPVFFFYFLVVPFVCGFPWIL
jgi:hypothetical protein